MALELFRIHDNYDIFYVSEFLTDAEQLSLLHKVTLQERKWVSLSNRRVQAHPSQLLNGRTLVQAPLPQCLTDIILDKFATLGIFTSSPHKGPNHVLVNEYLPGQGISPHEDGDVYHPLVATVSLGSHSVYNLYSKDTSRTLVAQIIQEPGSCMITCGHSYDGLLHGIDPSTEDNDLSMDTILNWDMISEEYQQSRLERKTRISLTYRDVKHMKTIMSLGRR